MGKVRFLTLGLAIAFLAGCVGNMTLTTESMAHDNISNLTRIAIGMDEDQVLSIMHAPYQTESFAKEGDQYDVWFYVTQMTGLGQTRMVPQNMTPLVFRNQLLVGWGYNYYHWALREEPAAPKKCKKPDVEQKKIEKILKGPANPSAVPPSSREPQRVVLPRDPKSEEKSKATESTPSKPQAKEKKYKYGPQPMHAPKQPKVEQPKVEQPPDPQQPQLQAMSKKAKAPPSENKPPEEEDPYLDEKGQEMIEEENEQDFDFW